MRLRRYFGGLAVLAMLAAVLIWPGSESPVEPTNALDATVGGPPSAPDEVLVRFRAGADRPAARGQARAQLVRRLAAVPGLELLRVERGTPPAVAAERLERRADVLYAEPNHRRFARGSVNDRYFPYLWGLHNTGQTIRGSAGTPDADIDAAEAWDVTTGDAAQPVAVVDTGIASAHPDLASQIAPGGYDFVEDDDTPQDADGHGTHVAGTLAARAGDGEGVAGVAHGTRVVPLRVLGADGSGTVADLVDAYGWAAARGIRVLNASLGGPSFSRAERDAVRAAADTLFVVAAGNGGDDGVGDDVAVAPEYPCAYAEPNIVCVAATDSSDRLAGFSNYGAVSVDVAAPGVSVLSAVPDTAWAWSDGTSMATPHVAGAAALVWARFPDAGVADVRAALLDSADPLPGLAGKVATGARLNAHGAVTLPLAAPAPAAPVEEPASEPIPPQTVEPAPAPPAAPEPEPTSPLPTDPPAESGNTDPLPDTAAPVVSLAVRSTRAVGVLVRRGVTLAIGCSEACTIDARLGLRTPRASVARTTARLATAGRRRVVIRVSRAARRRIARTPGRRLRVVVTLRVRDRAQNLRRVQRVVYFARR